MPIFFATVPLLLGGFTLGVVLRSGSPRALHDATGYAVVAALLCAPLSLWSLIRYMDWQRAVRTGALETGKITSLARFEGKGVGYFLSVERPAAKATLLRVTVMGQKPDLQWIGESYAVGDGIPIVTGKRGTVRVVLGDRLIDARETARKANE